MENQYILLVEDDPAVQSNNKKMLERRGYEIRQAFTLADAWSIIAKDPPRAIILDVQLPDGSGLDLLRELRESSTIPILMLTALSTPDDVIKGLETGGDVYLPKPYKFNILLSHLEALLRRSSTIPDSIVFGPFKLIPASNTAFMNGEDMLLAQKEFALLQQFVQYPERPLTVDFLYEKVWGQPMYQDAAAVKNQVYNLRKKLAGSGYIISAERGSGYSFERI